MVQYPRILSPNLKRVKSEQKVYAFCLQLSTYQYNFMSLLDRNKIRFCILLLLTLLFSFEGRSQAEENFPLYTCIDTNVQFWEDVYSRYTTRQGILHDKDNLDIVYTVVDLVDWETSGSAKINKKLIKLARERYKQILAKLAAGKKPETDEEKTIAAFFHGKSHHALMNAKNNIRLQIGQKDRFLDGVVRSGAYMPTIKKIFTTYGLPSELAYLPHVESSFNPEAHSKAGAAGLWQFTRSTGRNYMTVNNIVDERYDPYFSTKAAAIFLKENHEELGSWPLAITAYNYGRSGMSRAKEKMGDYANIFNNHRTGLFKFAARNFYPEFLAALRVARRIEAGESLTLTRPEATISVRMANYADALDLLAHFKISERDFSRLNPSLQKSVLTGKKYIPKHFLVRLPANDRIRTLAASIPSHIYHDSQIRDSVYIVRRGDTAGSIARRYRIPLSELVQANMLDRRATIRIGQKLKIPPASPQKNIENIITLESQYKKIPD